MEQEKKTVTENHQRLSIPQFDDVTLLTFAVLILISGLLMTDRIVPDFAVPLLTLLVGVKVHTAQQAKDFSTSNDLST